MTEQSPLERLLELDRKITDNVNDLENLKLAVEHKELKQQIEKALEFSTRYKDRYFTPERYEITADRNIMRITAFNGDDKISLEITDPKFVLAWDIANNPQLLLQNQRTEQDKKKIDWYDTHIGKPVDARPRKEGENILQYIQSQELHHKQNEQIVQKLKHYVSYWEDKNDNTTISVTSMLNKLQQILGEDK